MGKVVVKENLAGNNWLISLIFEEEMLFLPGQYASIKVDEEGHRRSYSIASLPGKKEVELLVDVSPMGLGSMYVLGLQSGDTVEMLGFLGNFVVEDDQLDNDLLFIATGTGIVPFKPIIEDLLINRGFKKEINLIWGMRYEKDLYWIEEMRRLTQDYPNFKFQLTLSKPGKTWIGAQGRVGALIDELKDNWQKMAVYLCGSTAMIEEMKEKLQNKGMSRDNIYYEKFF